ncbi:DUF1330 domain-containing protein [Rhizobium leucaenae]|uniref:Uncharacterized protein (DUF1330 family) n=1 Tax=Rhizobium leucaenae TaxID=29450 RepID=A0A7W6ZS09_9HYPH|nr:DUF1330 domain-containing protein [Rhizobium leucaenae]MBB4567686.1 uncharacterized protein (DUF1330 family) [Rhizobium leucaenae]MBB6301748.1 uncharacterized protein (DUF1330 family) [Rhizobium leucaenae]
MSGYWIVKGGEIQDAEALKTYGEMFAAIAKRYRVEIIAGRGAVETVEGKHAPRQLILRFDSYEAAKACYHDPEYQASLEFAARAYSRELSILEGSDEVTR